MSTTRVRWTPAIDRWLRDTFPDNQSDHLAALLGCSAAALRVRAGNLGLRKSHEWRSKNASETVRARSPFSPEIVEIIDLMYADIRTADLAEFIGMPTSRIHAMAKRRELRKSPDVVRQMARDRMTPEHGARRFQFPKGHIPANKGKKGINYPGMMATQFKKGRPAHEAHNYVPIGSLKVNPDGYLARKVTDDPSIFPVRRWETVHRLVWIAAHGPIPEKHMVRFRPGMFSTKLEEITLDRLELVTFAENARRNHWANNPTLKALVPLKTHITRHVNRIAREAKERSAS